MIGYDSNKQWYIIKKNRLFWTCVVNFYKIVGLNLVKFKETANHLFFLALLLRLDWDVLGWFVSASGPRQKNIQFFGCLKKSKFIPFGECKLTMWI
jgi:hypothetical protein